jgi:5-methyltetrahydropteroyltriglutamate--homocysteine methyltransferase
VAGLERARGPAQLLLTYGRAECKGKLGSAMQRSESHILTTHAGALPRPDDLLALNAERVQAEQSGQAFDDQAHHLRLKSAVGDVVKQQSVVGIEVVNDGEFGKTMRTRLDYGAWLSYVMQRLTGWEPAPTSEHEEAPSGITPQGFYKRRDRQAFPDLYVDIDKEMFAGGRRPMSREITSPITYKGQAALESDIANLRAAFARSGAAEGFMTAVAPGSFGREQNRYYPSQEEFLFAIADAMRTEYRAIVDAGFILQIDDPGMAENWDAMDPSVTLEEYRDYARQCIAALNHALEGIPEDRVRYHMCWGSWHGPHLTDIPLRDIVDVLLTVRAGAFSVEAGNVRHEHEWKVWRDVKLPPGKLLIPGVVSHATNVVEHPEVVADRIVQNAQVVGRENVIAGTDCGLGGRIHPALAWAKLRVLAEGAELASHQLWS